MKRSWGIALALLLMSAGVAQAHDFPPPPGHAVRIDTRTFVIDSGWFKIVEGRICPGSNNVVTNHYKDPDSSGTIVVCDDNAFFKPEVPVLNFSPANAYYPRIVTKTKYKTRDVVRYKQTHTLFMPTLFFSLLFAGCGVILGYGVRSVIAHNQRQKNHY